MLVTLLHWQRYAALGDAGAWSNRLAGILQVDARLRGRAFEYDDLGAAPTRITQLVGEQVPRAIALGADLASILIGSSDLVRAGADPDALADELEGGVASLRATGCDVLLATCIEPRFAFLITPLRQRAAAFNANLWSIARTHGTLTVDLWGARELQSRSVWGPDRVHLSPEGHRAVASRAAHALGVPYFESRGRPSTVDFWDGFQR